LYTYKSKDSLQIIAAEWNKLTEIEQIHWQEVSRNDRLRYARELSEYAGPKVKRRLRKHSLAPKRPMSAFLKYSKVHRSSVRAMNPTLLNTDISRILGEMWRAASDEIKSKFIIEAEREHEIFKRDSATFRLQTNLENPVVKEGFLETPNRWLGTQVRPQELQPNPEPGYVRRGSYDSTGMLVYGVNLPKFHTPMVNARYPVALTDSKLFALSVHD